MKLKFSKRIVVDLKLSVSNQEDVEEVWDVVLPRVVRGFPEAPISEHIRSECTVCGNCTSYPWAFTGKLTVPSNFDSTTGFGPRLAAELEGNHSIALKEALLQNDNAFFQAYTTHRCGPEALIFTVECIVPQVLLVGTTTGWFDETGRRAPAPGDDIPLRMAGVEATLSTGQFLPGVAFGDTPDEVPFFLRSVVLREGTLATQGHYTNLLQDNAGG